MHVGGRTAVAAILVVASAVAAASPIETTTVEGDLPEAVIGRWLVVEQTRLRTGGLQPSARLWEMRRTTSGVEMVLPRVRLPEAIGRRLAAAGSAGRVWGPGDEDLLWIAERWDVLPRSVTDVQRVEHRLGASGGGLEIVTAERFSGARPVTATRSTYTVRERDARRLVGRFARVAEITTPTPLSLHLEGDFQSYRLPPVPPRSGLRRFFDAWLGRLEPS